MSWVIKLKARLRARIAHLKRRETPGWFGNGTGESSLTDPAYSRVTNPERFRPLHTAMLAIIDRLESDFEVECAEGFGFDEKLARGLDLARADVRLTPKDPDAAPVSVVFTAFPGLRIRFGWWYIEPFPVCGCDACDESEEDEIERLTEMIDDVTAGRFREAIEIPLLSFMGAGWVDTRFWSPDGRRRRHRSRVDRSRGREMSRGRHRLALNWKPWPRRQLARRGGRGPDPILHLSSSEFAESANSRPTVRSRDR